MGVGFKGVEILPFSLDNLSLKMLIFGCPGSNKFVEALTIDLSTPCGNFKSSIELDGVDFLIDGNDFNLLLN